ncbi:MAG: glycosyltransferase [Bacillota bacterium]|nr:glycosyltransferase [Bacillota bacterium]
MKKLLILTASTGAGHNQAANSLSQAFMEKGYYVNKYDFLKEGDKFLNIVVAEGYDFLAKSLPRVYGNIYKLSDHKTLNDRLLKKYPKRLENRLLKFIQESKPDIIIGTHPLSVAVIGKLKEKDIIDIPFISIVTDFKAHYAYIDNNVDAYITASEYTKTTLMERDVPEDKVFPFGIPVKKEFYVTPKEIKEESRFSILMMSGSMGLKGIGAVLKELTNNKNKLKVTVVCGNNKELYDDLNDKYLPYYGKGELNILGFTNEVPKLMSESDVIISKPGGLTVSEALICKLPLIIPFAIPGQEEENSEFLVNAGAAISMDDIDNLNDIIDKLIESPEIIKRMKDNIEKISGTNSIEEIIELADKIIENRNCRIN